LFPPQEGAPFQPPTGQPQVGPPKQPQPTTVTQ